MELGPKERVLVGGDVEAVGVRPNVGIVANAGKRIGPDGVSRPGAVMIGRAHGAVILDRDAVDGPRAQRACGLTDGNVEMVRAQERAGMRRCRLDIERQHDVEPALGCLIEIAAGFGHEGTVGSRATDNLWRIAVERVEVGDALERVSGAAVDVHDVIDGLEHKAVPDAEPLVGRFDGVLVPVIGGALIPVIETEAAVDDAQGTVYALVPGRFAVARLAAVLGRVAAIRSAYARDAGHSSRPGSGAVADAATNFRLGQGCAARTRRTDRCRTTCRDHPRAAATWCGRSRSHRDRASKDGENSRRRQDSMSEQASSSPGSVAPVALSSTSLAQPQREVNTL